jgi:hypothetical protein
VRHISVGYICFPPQHLLFPEESCGSVLQLMGGRYFVLFVEPSSLPLFFLKIGMKIDISWNSRENPGDSLSWSVNVQFIDTWINLNLFISKSFFF